MKGSNPLEGEAGKKLDVFNGLVIWKRYNLTHITYNTENDSSSPNLRVSLLADILNSTKNLRGAIFPKEAREITSFTGFSGLFYELPRKL